MFSIMLAFKNYTSIVQKGWSQNENGSKIINDLDSKKTRDFAFKINLCMFHFQELINYLLNYIELWTFGVFLIRSYTQSHNWIAMFIIFVKMCKKWFD
jgi:hypothetical protein